MQFGEEMKAGASLLSRPAEEFVNDPQVEALWAMKAVEHSEIYFNLLCSLDPKFLKLTPHDKSIYEAFREEFPDFKVDKIEEDQLKSEEAKAKWRPFCEKFKDIVQDYSFGTLLRLDCDDEYSESNSILVTRIQFFALEIARNLEGHNGGIMEKFKGKTSKEDG